MGESSPLGITRCSGREFRWGEKTYVMGIINMTPDSFAGDGLENDVAAALEQALHFQEQGADIIDVGGESTRPPGLYQVVSPISVEEELHRVIPVIERLSRELGVPISIDTYKSEVARRALAAGASMVNDIWGLKFDRGIADLAASEGAALVLMHNQQGTEYRDLLPDVIASLQSSMELALAAGVPKENIIVDPGIGFGKTSEQNLEVLRRLDEIKTLGRPILVGASRKSTIGLVLDLPVDQRMEGTAATVALAIARGADIVRVHDVKEMARVAKMSDSIVRGWKPFKER